MPLTGQNHAVRRVIKLLGVVLASYVLLVAIITATIGYVQPTMPGEVVLTTYDAQGNSAQRTLAGVRATIHGQADGQANDHAGTYTAVAVTGAELVHITEAYQVDFVLRFVTGFAPRRFMRLEPSPS